MQRLAKEKITLQERIQSLKSELAKMNIEVDLNQWITLPDEQDTNSTSTATGNLLWIFNAICCSNFSFWGSEIAYLFILKVYYRITWEKPVKYLFLIRTERERDVEIIEEANYCIPYSGLFFIEPCATEESSTVTRRGGPIFLKK